MATRIARPETAFPLSAGAIKRTRARASLHLEFVRSLPCLLTGRFGSTEAAHIRYGSLHHGKPTTGGGEKPSDWWTVPLSSEMHRRQHDYGDERRFWASRGIDPLVVAALLYVASGDHEACSQIISAARAGRFPIKD